MCSKRDCIIYQSGFKIDYLSKVLTKRENMDGNQDVNNITSALTSSWL